VTRKARLRKSESVGKLRLHRLYLEQLSRDQLPDKIRAAQGRARKIKRLNPVGLKLIFVPGLAEGGVRTSYGRIVIARRRAANKVARRSRKANR
jgi:hypothetical protein